MKLTRERLKQIIKEELKNSLEETRYSDDYMDYGSYAPQSDPSADAQNNFDYSEHKVVGWATVREPNNTFSKRKVTKMVKGLDIPEMLDKMENPPRSGTHIEDLLNYIEITDIYTKNGGHISVDGQLGVNSAKQELQNYRFGKK